MIDITKAQMNQTTTNGHHSEWTVTLGDEEFFRLPNNFTVQEAFLVRDVVRNLMLRAERETKAEQEQLCLVKMNYVQSAGESQLDALKSENLRLSAILQETFGEEA